MWPTFENSVATDPNLKGVQGKFEYSDTAGFAGLNVTTIDDKQRAKEARNIYLSAACDSTNFCKRSNVRIFQNAMLVATQSAHRGGGQ